MLLLSRSDPSELFRPDRSDGVDRSESKLALGGFASSTFASNTKRFKPKPCDGNPAPGDYNAPGGMASKALKLAERAGDAEPMVQWNRMQTAPSIPSKHQSYGFRKSADRGIVPLKSRDGAKSRVDEAPTQKKYKGVDWSKNKTARFPPKKSDKNPGPTAYDTSEPIEKPRRQSPPRQSGLSYNELQEKKKLEEAGAVPGPGVYIARIDISRLLSGQYGVPDKSVFDVASMQKAGDGFGVTANRFVYKCETGDVGPGQYGDPSKTGAFKLKSAHPLATHITPFGTTSSRCCADVYCVC